MDKTGQIALALAGFCWAQSMLVLGLSQLLAHQPVVAGPAMGLALVAAGLFLAMWLVIDRLVPEASPIFTGTLKLAMLVLFYVCGAAVLVRHWPIDLV